MKNLQLRMLLLLTTLSIGLLGCSTESDVPAPTKNSKQQSTETQTKTIKPEELYASLKNHSQMMPLGDIPIPEDNPMTEEVLKLGQTLFFDPRLSGNNQVSCATCHDPNMGYGDDRPTFKAYDGSDGARNSPTVINSGYYSVNFWDGRAASLEEQALGPIENPNEMNQKLSDLVPELKVVEGYKTLFLAAFPDGITEQNIAKALAAFQRQIVVKDTPYDRFLEGDMNALTQEELRGLKLFTGKAFCFTCHNGENLSDNQYYNIGLNTEDKGRFEITKDEADIGRIRTASLYGITHTAPYMHNGSIATLEEVIEFYDRGGDGHPNTSFFMKQFMQPLGLTKAEKADLLAFLKSLGGEVPLYAAPELPGL
ncbi:cytochrome-c peroxidase [Bacillus marasmi]|uniref:cytochrome-c peroxidase n=1 Tax=Bacillus marasmi TaxID=1926279 RepID=UPI0011CC9EEF|nr:cytochrome c peroxidase [Bacillus marasmi]